MHHPAKATDTLTWNANHSTRSVPYRLQQACFIRDHYTCQRCGHQGRKGDGTLHADHIHNRATGGADSLHNLITLCTPCHHDKTAHERTEGIARRKAALRLPEEPHPGRR